MTQCKLTLLYIIYTPIKPNDNDKERKWKIQDAWTYVPKYSRYSKAFSTISLGHFLRSKIVSTLPKKLN